MHGRLAQRPSPLQLPPRRRSSAAGVHPPSAARLFAAAAELIDGKAIAETIRQELKAEVDELKAKHGGKVGCRVLMLGVVADVLMVRPSIVRLLLDALCHPARA